MSVAVGFKNGIGNFVMFTPVLQLIADRLEKPDLLLDKEWDDEGKRVVEMMARKMPFINKIVPFEHKEQLEQYDHTYQSWHGFLSRSFQAINGIQGDAEATPFWAGNFIHEITWYIFEAMEALKIRGGCPPQYMPVGRLPKGLPEKYLVIANGYLRSETGIWDKKAWPHWVDAVGAIRDLFNLDVLVLGGDDDVEWGAKLKGLPGVVDLTGKTSILQTAAIVKHSVGIISTDTGVMHIADALMKPGIALMGPTLVSKNGPWNGTVMPIRSTKKCAPCQGTELFEQCTDRDCMKLIEPGMVMAAARTIFRPLLFS